MFSGSGNGAKSILATAKEDKISPLYGKTLKRYKNS